MAGRFELTAKTRIEGCFAETRLLAEALRPATGFDLPVTEAGDADSAIRLFLVDSAEQMDGAYRLKVLPGRVELSAATRAGLFYGIQTLLQLLPAEIFLEAERPGPWTIPAVEIEDRPRFGWRGMHLDCARHFMPKEFVKKFIDLLALHKMNVFHWHLTEDQGWRIEIKKHPKLTEVAAWRSETLIGHNNNTPPRYDGTRHGGFYTQDDVREIVAYAARRHITVVPEIEMPGHSQAVLAAYPELGCTGGPYHVRKIWGVSEDVFCAGEDKVFQFLENVLSEVMELFPGEFIHIGGDECLKMNWEKCPKCQARIKAEGLADTHELQSWFIRRMETFLNRHGRRLIGWDEILEGGLAPNATVMSWRGTEGGVKAIKEGHDTVFATNSHTYFDYFQSQDTFAEPLAIGGFLPIEKVYAYEPIPDGLTLAEAAHILGVQGQLWTEYMETPKQVEYMAFPRMSALSEVAWSPKQGKDYSDFRRRMPEHLRRLYVLDVNYRPQS